MIYPDCDMNRWEYCDNTVVLGNADYYYTKQETNELIAGVSGMSPSQVQDMINNAIRVKADKSTVESLAEVVRQQGQAILNTYTKSEVNSLLNSYLTKIEANGMIAEYAAIDGDTLSLNNNNISLS